MRSRSEVVFDTDLMLAGIVNKYLAGFQKDQNIMAHSLHYGENVRAKTFDARCWKV